MVDIRNKDFSKNVMEVIKSRQSIRTYKPEKLSEEIKRQLMDFAKGIRGPFSPKVRLVIIDNYNILDKVNGKIGTYGVIKDSPHFIAAIVEVGQNNLEQLGYVLEKLILYATSLDLGTCWIGGTFKRSEFAKLVELKEEEILPVITPIGYSTVKKSMLDTLMRYSAASNKRKSWADLFYNESFNSPMDVKDGYEYEKALEAVRLAPSASNKQPWRILKKGNVYHFYLKANKGYGNALGFNIQRIDIGIAMCHFEMVLQEQGRKGNWIIEDPTIYTAEEENLTYIVSYI